LPDERGVLALFTTKTQRHQGKEDLENLLVLAWPYLAWDLLFFSLIS
jgi:hypothetical protein